jgi:recombinational DNA repair protein RecR
MPDGGDRIGVKSRKGIAFDLNQLKPENLDELIDQLNELTVDVDEQAKVRVFAE